MTEPRTILVTSPTFGRYSEASLDRLRDAGFELARLDRGDPDIDRQVADHLPSAVAWVVGYYPIDAETLDRAPNLAVIAKHGTGVDNIDLEAARDRGVVVANAPGMNANAVAELVVLHMLNLNRRLVTADRMVRSGEWGDLVGRDIGEKTIGIVGLGAIGQTLVERTQGFDLEYLALDEADRDAFLDRFDVTMVDELTELLERSDFVTLHVPLTEQTRQLIGRQEFEAMHSTACLINTARGGIVDEDALVEALDRGEIAGAALDVLDEEPPSESARYDTLLADERVTFSPHIGGYTEEAFRAISDVTTENILDAIDGTDPAYRVV